MLGARGLVLAMLSLWPSSAACKASLAVTSGASYSGEAQESDSCIAGAGEVLSSSTRPEGTGQEVSHARF